MFWGWLLKYSSFFITGIVSLLVGWLLHRLTSTRAELVYYASHVQFVTLPPPQPGQPAVGPIGTFALFLWNPGKAPAREVHVGHFWLPANNVFPDIPRDVTPTPGGGAALRFPVIPPKTVVSISYLFFGIYTMEQIISYVGWEGGSAKKIPVILQRIWPKWFTSALSVIFFLGLWTTLNIFLTVIEWLWRVYYAK